jgi:NADH-quinone oxidoreductase subunit B
VTVSPYELEQFGDLDDDELVQHLADQIDEDELVMRYDWAESPSQ